MSPTKRQLLLKCDEVIPAKGEIDLKEHYPDISDREFDRLASLVAGEGKYMLDPTPKEKVWILRNDPNYHVRESAKRTNRVQRRILKLTFGVSILTLIITATNIYFTLSNQHRQIHIQEQQRNLQPPTIRIDSVIVRHSKMDMRE